jgi:hypothetical protein
MLVWLCCLAYFIYIMLSVNMLSVNMMNLVMLSVVAPDNNWQPF